jgi:hypothetical protein
VWMKPELSYQVVIMYTQQFYDCSVHAVITAMRVTSHSWWMNLLVQYNFPRAFLVHCITNGRCQSPPPTAILIHSVPNGHWEQSEPKWFQLMMFHMFFLTHF